MLVFIDESGDPGFKIENGSSPVFVLGMVIFPHTDEAARADKIITEARIRNRIKPEWKFTKSSFAARDDFFASVAPVRFLCRCLVVKKELIRSDHLRTEPRRFYNFFTRLMCEHDGGHLKNASIIIDGSGDRAFKLELQAYMRQNLEPGTIKKMTFKDSRKDSLVQLADMCTGAVARSYADHRPDANRWRDVLHRARRIDDIWDFK